MRNGHMTLPVLLEMRNNPTFKEKVVTLNRQSDTADFEWCINQIRNSDVIQQSLDISQKYLDKATSLLDTLPKSDITPHFKKLIKRLQNRMH
ncbi:heptaprenyl diphosphate synthase component II [Staphylococcus schleiferi]|uniref:Heptaprenyl diphosphate synthase component II n=1 Tax=Staphylococcus schleiferi TaxID=1295 RepID=A0A7Z7QPK1_STASC|nr:heptaprenyl diphosphate synthase component II [Staphylococcus schleiferi]SUM88878.1 heptaprenyl diphosphate synthase component II [Staphylococcus schleiferi]